MLKKYNLLFLVLLIFYTLVISYLQRLKDQIQHPITTLFFLKRLIV